MYTSIPMQNPPSFSSNHIRLAVGDYTRSHAHEEQKTCPRRFGICAGWHAHRSALGRSQSSLPPLFQLWNPGPVLRASGEARSCARPALLCTAGEAHQLQFSTQQLQERRPCQVPVFDSPLHQAVASSFPGHPATFQKEQDWPCLGQQRHTASLTSHYYELACTMNSVEELSIWKGEETGNDSVKALQSQW